VVVLKEKTVSLECECHCRYPINVSCYNIKLYRLNTLSCNKHRMMMIDSGSLLSKMLAPSTSKYMWDRKICNFQ